MATICLIVLILVAATTDVKGLIGIGDESCDRVSGCANITRRGNTIYFGLMLSYPDPLGRETLAAAFDDGHEIAPAAYLAIEQINNRSDILSDYQIEVIRLDGGCTVTERTVIGMNRLACSCEPIVGIIGPSCGTSALTVGELTGRDQFSMVTIHYGEKSIFGDRTIFPFAFAMLGSNFITIQAFTELIMHNHWTRIALLYSEEDSDLGEVSLGIENNIKGIEGYEIAFTSPIYETFIPLDAIPPSFARVIIVLASAESTLNTMCLAYHKGMIFPKYQWVFKERFDFDFSETSVHYEGNEYYCSDENVTDSIFRSISLVWSAVAPDNNRTNTDIGLTSTEYVHEYNKSRLEYMLQHGENSTLTDWARGFYDAVWSLAFALNSSLVETNMNLTQIVPGSKMLTQTLAEHMFNVDFQGISGQVRFDNKTGSNIAGELNIYQFGEEKMTTLVGLFTSGMLKMLNNSTAHFIKSTFDKRSVQVTIAIAVPFLIITVATLLVAIPIQIINIIYREHKTIKATSPNLNHIIFIGCYLTVFGNVLFIVTEGWQHTDNPQKSHLCNVIPWFIGVGTSMIIGTVCTKTWRLHRIYASSKRVVRLSPKLLSDPVLGGVVGVFVLIDIVICLVWVSVDPLTSTKTTKLQVSSDEKLPTIDETVTCESTWLIYWSAVFIGYKCLITATAFVLAIFTRIKKKEFKTVNVIVLAYLFAIAFGLGVPMYIIVSVINVGLSIRFTILCLLINTIVYICLFALFLPSIIPLIREKVFHYEDPQLVLKRHGTYIYSRNSQVMLFTSQRSFNRPPLNRQASVPSFNRPPLNRQASVPSFNCPPFYRQSSLASFNHPANRQSSAASFNRLNRQISVTSSNHPLNKQTSIVNY